MQFKTLSQLNFLFQFHSLHAALINILSLLPEMWSKIATLWQLTNLEINLLWTLTYVKLELKIFYFVRNDEEWQQKRLLYDTKGWFQCFKNFTMRFFSNLADYANRESDEIR